MKGRGVGGYGAGLLDVKALFLFLHVGVKGSVALHLVGGGFERVAGRRLELEGMGFHLVFFIRLVRGGLLPTRHAFPVTIGQLALELLLDFLDFRE